MSSRLERQREVAATLKKRRMRIIMIPLTCILFTMTMRMVGGGQILEKPSSHCAEGGLEENAGMSTYGAASCQEDCSFGASKGPSNRRDADTGALHLGSVESS